jgi:hypothetical protein
LPGVATGTRGHQAALKQFAPEEANLIVITHHALELPQDHLPYKLGQMIVQRIPVYLKCVILAMLALVDERIVVVLRQGGVKIDPPAAARAKDFATHGWISTELKDHFAQLRSGGHMPARASGEDLLQSIAARVFRAGQESMLTVPRNRQQLAEGHNGVTVVHGAFPRHQFILNSECATAPVVPDA